MSNTSAIQYIATLLWPFYINKLCIKSFHFHFSFTDQKIISFRGYDVTTYLASFLFFACGQIFLWAGRGNHVSSSLPMTMIQIYTMCIPSFCISQKRPLPSEPLYCIPIFTLPGDQWWWWGSSFYSHHALPADDHKFFCLSREIHILRWGTDQWIHYLFIII